MQFLEVWQDVFFLSLPRQENLRTESQNAVLYGNVMVNKFWTSFEQQTLVKDCICQIWGI